MKIRDLIKSALITCDGIAIGETPNNDEINRGLLKFNQIIGLRLLDNNWAYTITTTTDTTTAGKYQYSVGNAVGDEDFLVDRPAEVMALMIKVSNIWHKVKQLSPIEFETMAKLESSVESYTPNYFTYRPNYPVGALELYPTPNEAFDLRLTQRYMKSSYLLDDDLNLPVGYDGYLEYALGAILAIDYGADGSALGAIANERLAILLRQNTQARKLKLPNLLGRSNKEYNIEGDYYYE
jgi:hypothetical protein